MDIPMEDQKVFQNVTSKIVASISEVTETNMLSMDFLNNVSVMFREPWSMNYCLFAILLLCAEFLLNIKVYLTLCLQVESEVSRLDHLNLSKMKDLIPKKRLELENVCRRAHMSAEAFSATSQLKIQNLVKLLLYLLMKKIATINSI